LAISGVYCTISGHTTILTHPVVARLTRSLQINFDIVQPCSQQESVDRVVIMQLDLAKSAALLERSEDVGSVVSTAAEAGDCAYLPLGSFGSSGEGQDTGKSQGRDGGEMHDDGECHGIFFLRYARTRWCSSAWATSTFYVALGICVVTSCCVVRAVPYPAQAERGSGCIWPEFEGSTSQYCHAMRHSDATMARTVASFFRASDRKKSSETTSLCLRRCVVVFDRRVPSGKYGGKEGFFHHKVPEKGCSSTSLHCVPF